MPPTPEDLEKGLDGLEQEVTRLKLWVAEHDGRIEAWWANQHAWNEKIEERLCDLALRLSAVEKRMMWWAGAAAGAGGWMGSYFG